MRKPTSKMIEALRHGAADKHGTISEASFATRTLEALVARDLADWKQRTDVYKSDKHVWGSALCVITDAGRAYLAELDAPAEVEAPEPQPTLAERLELPDLRTETVLARFESTMDSLTRTNNSASLADLVVYAGQLFRILTSNGATKKAPREFADVMLDAVLHTKLDLLADFGRHAAQLWEERAEKLAARADAEVAEIVDAVLKSSRREQVMARARQEGVKPLDFGRTVSFHAYGMSPQEIERVDWTSVRTALLAADVEAPQDHGYTWGDVREVKASELALGDIFVKPGTGAAYYVAPDGTVRGTRITSEMPMDGTAWAVAARAGETYTCISHTGEKRTGPIPGSARVLRVETAREKAEANRPTTSTKPHTLHPQEDITIMNATTQDALSKATQAIPAAHRDQVTITPLHEPQALSITLAPVWISDEQRAALAQHTEGTRERRRAEGRVTDAMAKEGRKVRDNVSAALRAAGFDVSDADEYPQDVPFPDGFALRSMQAVPVTYGESASDAGKAWESGVERGWDHANFVQAYGKEHDARKPEVPGYHQDHAGAFEQGWREGRKRFNRNRYADGTKIED